MAQSTTNAADADSPLAATTAPAAPAPVVPAPADNPIIAAATSGASSGDGG
ncbi:MAG: hypothetical protein U1E53_23460 [Dongiaceae bacterium]